VAAETASIEFEDDSAAIDLLLKAGYVFTRGGLIRAPSQDHIETWPETQALSYLFLEWDYADEPRDQWKPST
jgi:hypothetical protein